MYTRAVSIGKFYLNKQFLSFFVAGFTAFLADFSVLSLLIYIVKFNPEIKLIDTESIKMSLFISNVVSVTVGILVGYAINRYWAFNSRSEKVTSQLSRYIAVCIMNLFINNAIFGFLVPIGIPAVIAKVIATGLQMIWTYVLYKVLVFKV
jgi:putative flippase GtrA